MAPDKDRMRRVNEAVREVFSTAIAKRPEGPASRFRDGHGRRHQPRPAPRARLRERARRRAAARASRSPGWPPRAATCRAAWRPSCGSSTRRSSTSTTTTASTAASRITELLRGGGDRPVSRTDTATEREQILAELNLGEKFLLTTHENPDGDALGSLLAMHEILKPDGQGLRHVHVGGGVPAARTSTATCRSRSVVARAARRRRRAHDRVPRLRQHRPHAGQLPPARRRAHPQHRSPPRQHALRHREPGRRQTPPAPPRSSTALHRGPRASS